MRRRRKGEGSFSIDKKANRYEYFERYVNSDGISKRKHIRAQSKEELDKKVSEWKQILLDGNLNEDKKITVSDWVERYKSIIKLSVKPKTYSHYVSMVDSYIKPYIGKIRLERLTTEKVQLWLNGFIEEQKLSPATVATVRRLLITILNVAMQYRIISYNAAFYSKPPRMQRKQPSVLTLEQVHKLLLTAAKGDFLNYGLKEPHQREEGDLFLHRVYFIALYLSLFCGTRKGETFALRWCDYDADTKQLFVRQSLSNYKKATIEDTKTAHSERTILLPTAVCELLNRWRVEQNEYACRWAGYYKNELHLILTNSIGHPVSFTNLHNRWWEKLRLASGLPEGFKWHNLRATNATLLAADNVDIKTVSERLGHSSPVVTEQYYLGQTGRQNEAANVLDRIIKSVFIEDAEVVTSKEDSTDLTVSIETVEDRKE